MSINYTLLKEWEEEDEYYDEKKTVSKNSKYDEDTSFFGLPEEIKPRCKLAGTDGNAYALTGRVAECLRKNNFKKKAEELKKNFSKECHNYDELLQFLMKYVDAY